MAKNNRKNEMFAKFAHVANKNIKQNQPNNPQNKETKMKTKEFTTPSTFAEFNTIVEAMAEKAKTDIRARFMHIFGKGVMLSVSNILEMVDDASREEIMNSAESFSSFASSKTTEDVDKLLTDMVGFLNGEETDLDIPGVIDETLISEFEDKLFKQNEFFSPHTKKEFSKLLLGNGNKSTEKTAKPQPVKTTVVKPISGLKKVAPKTSLQNKIDTMLGIDKKEKIESHLAKALNKGFFRV